MRLFAIKTTLALKMLTARPIITVIKLLSLTFAIILIFMQLALYELILISAVQQYDMLDFDVLLTSSGYIDMMQPSAIKRNQVSRVLSDPAVDTATPFYVSSVSWRNLDDGLKYPILVLGAPPDSPSFTRDDVQEQLHLLKRDQGVLFDLRSMPLYGPRYVGLNTIAGRKNVTVVGSYSNGAGFSSAGAVIVSDATFFSLVSGRDAFDTTMGLVKLKPGVSTDEVVNRLRRILPDNVRVWKRDELKDHERTYWTQKKPMGIMFSSGVLMGFLIGGVIFYQVLATNIIKHMREFATMKAIGYSNADVSQVVLLQAIMYGVCCFIPALLTAIGMYEFLRVGAAINITMTISKASIVFFMTLGLCSGCSWLAIRKIRTIDPAELF